MSRTHAWAQVLRHASFGTIGSLPIAPLAVRTAAAGTTAAAAPLALARTAAGAGSLWASARWTGQPRSFASQASRGFASGRTGKGGASSGQSEGGSGSGSNPASEKGLASVDETFDAITDKIPPKPVTFVEGTSYSLVIVAALGFAAAIVYAALKELLLSPKEHTAFNQAVDRLREDPRVTVRLGSPVGAYGTESHNRAARQQVPHREYVDAKGREHLQIQFHLHGPGGRATVNADMYIDPEVDPKQYQYRFLYMAVDGPRGASAQVVFARPSATDEAAGEFI